MKEILQRVLARLVACQRGATLPEYALVVALFAVVTMGAIGQIDSNAGTYYDSTSSQIGTPPTTIPPPPAVPPTPSEPPPPLTVTVSSMVGTAASCSGNCWTASILITVRDSTMTPFAGATVTGSWNPAGLSTNGCTTAANGTCTVTITGMKANGGGSVNQAVYTVSNVSAGSRPYVAGSVTQKTVPQTCANPC